MHPKFIYHLLYEQHKCERRRRELNYFLTLLKYMFYSETVRKNDICLEGAGRGVDTLESPIRREIVNRIQKQVDFGKLHQKNCGFWRAFPPKL